MLIPRNILRYSLRYLIFSPMQTQTIFICLFFMNLASATLTSNLPRGSSLNVKDAASKLLVSPDKTFTCGFYTFNDSTNAYYFSIWFSNSKEKTVIWTANRDKPVNSLGSRVTLRKDGALVLTDFDGSNVWETNTSTTSVARAELLNSGNLVLKDSKGNIFWQSFDFPTDTLLPSQLFSKNKRLISRISPLDFSHGYYRFFFDNDNVLKLMYDGSEISSLYWPDLKNRTALYQAGRINYNISGVANLDDMGTFISSDQLRFRASDIGFGIKRRLTMDYDGNLRLYSLSNSSGLWVITWQAVAKHCDVHGICGRNGICVYAPMPKCSCPPYFEPSSSTDWSKGCKPKFERSCSDSEFVEITHVNFNGYDLNYAENVSLEHCRQLCLGDCRCQAFKHKRTMKCLTKGALYNGYSEAKTSFYIRIPRRVLTSEPKIILNNVLCLDCGNGNPKINVLKTFYDSSKEDFKWIYMYSFSGAIGAIEGIIFVVSWYFFFRKQSISSSLEEGYRTISSRFRSFTYSELMKATEKFKHVVGKGGFGAVYKGVLRDARVVAVKKLENIVQGEEEFWAEVSIFGRINHMNLARIWGFCSEGKHRVLVYEYVENGSLDNHLFSSTSNFILDWDQRFKIALGTAKGLAYLHHECLEWVIHCDVKPGNILLDSNFEPKISDFGLVKLCQRGVHGLSNLSRIRGTKGYMAPEWTTNLPLTAKADVYSYGVVILELVKGTRLSGCTADDSLGEEEIVEFTSFVRMAKRRMRDGEDSWMDDLVDRRLDGKFSNNQARRMIEVGLLCVEHDRNKRPTMEAIVQVLAGCEDETAPIM